MGKKKWILLFIVVFVLIFMFVGNDEEVLDMNLAAAATTGASNANSLSIQVEAINQQVEEDQSLPGTSMTHEQMANSNASVLDIIYTILKEDGLNDVAIAGVLGNFHEESGYDPAIVQGNGVGYGLAQWSWPSRKKGMLLYLQNNDFPQITDEVIATAMAYGYTTVTWKRDVLRNYSEQALTVREMEYLIQEMNSAAYAQAWNDACRGYSGFKNATTVENSALWFHNVMESSSDGPEGISERIEAGEIKLDEIRRGEIKSLQIVASNPQPSSDIDEMIRIAEEICNNDNYGYNDPWPDRTGIFDCSGFVSYCIKKSIDPNAERMNTSNLNGYLVNHGWTNVTNNDEIDLSTGAGLLRGDIINVPGSHTEFYYGNGQTIGSHDYNADHSKEICPVPYSANSFDSADTTVWRYEN